MRILPHLSLQAFTSPFFFYFYVKHIVKGQWREAAGKKREHERVGCVILCMCACMYVYMRACVPTIMSVIPRCVCMHEPVCAFSGGDAVSPMHAVLIEKWCLVPWGVWGDGGCR